MASTMEAGPEHGIASGEDAGDARRQSLLVGIDQAALADRDDDSVGLQNRFLGIIKPRIELLVLVEDAGAGAEGDGAGTDFDRPEAVVYTLTSQTTVLQLIATAGGLTEFADQKNVSVMRIENGKPVRYPFNYKDVAKGKNLKQNIELKPGDTVIVP